MRTTVDVGNVVSVPLQNGRFALIWILGVESRNVEFLVLDGFWETLPDRPTALSAPVAPSSAPRIDDDLEVWKGWINGKVPNDFVCCGVRPLGPKEHAYAAAYSGTMIFGTAERLRVELYKHWRFQFDRDALFAGWARQDAEREARRAQRRATNTLEQMLRERFSLGFGTDASPNAVRTAKRIFRDATKELIALRDAGTEAARREVLRRIALQLNAVEDHGAEIDSIVREAIGRRVEELARLAGVADDLESLLRGREW